MREMQLDDEYFAYYRADEDIVYNVFCRVIDFYSEHGMVTGEAIMQSDACHLDAVRLMADIADNVIGFTIRHIDNEEEYPMTTERKFPYYLYLHTNGSLIYKPKIVVDCDPDYFVSDFVLDYWYIDSEESLGKVLEVAKKIKNMTSYNYDWIKND